MAIIYTTHPQPVRPLGTKAKALELETEAGLTGTSVPDTFLVTFL
jgi:hypothetical protein